MVIRCLFIVITNIRIFNPGLWVRFRDSYVLHYDCIVHLQFCIIYSILAIKFQYRSIINCILRISRLRQHYVSLYVMLLHQLHFCWYFGIVSFKVWSKLRYSVCWSWLQLVWSIVCLLVQSRQFRIVLSMHGAKYDQCHFLCNNIKLWSCI